MTFLSPLPLVLAGAVALGVLALHLLTTRRPPPTMLPTARFVPLTETRAVARTSRPTDLLLMVLRMLAVLLIGAAFARPVFDASGPAIRTVVMLDVSRAVADPAAARAAAAAQMGEGGALVVFDTAAHELVGTTDSLVTPDSAPGASRAAVGSMSPAFVVARRAAARIARGADSVRLVLVSPLVEGAVDAATPGLRGAWPGRVEVVRVAAATDTARGDPATLVTPLEDDPLAPAVAAVGGLRGAPRVRIVRAASAEPVSPAADLAGADVLIIWPAAFDDSIAPAGVTAFDPSGDGSTTIVAPLGRLPLDTTTAGARVIARWNDGSAAAVQAPADGGCVRHVGIGVPLAGDLTLRAPFTRFLEVLLAPCGGTVGAPLPDEAIAFLQPAEAAPLASAADVAASVTGEGSRWPLILLVAATALLVVELLARRRSPA